VLLWMAPPVHVTVEVHEPPFPDTVKPPDAPVPLRTIPFVPPLEEMLRKVRPLAPMVVLLTLSAVPVVVLIVLSLVPIVTLTAVPGLVALNAMPDVVVMASPPLEKLIVAPVFVARFTAPLAPVLMVLVLPLKLNVPPVLLATLTPVPDPRLRLPLTVIVA